ncbi:ATP-binding protein [Isoptericola croceus]|uniref:ATP-binding protein n=1 Tax=Isoptericola croceus TaxID=3031406 RepID=UPI0023F876CB|nr:DUF234 domain-containing protein [Isoptericola croceus]
MVRFIGRDTEMASLDRLLRLVQRGDDHPGRAIAIRGRRRVGKSRLVTEWLRRTGLPSLHFTAEGSPLDQDLPAFVRELRTSTLPDAAGFGTPASWSDALQLLALVVPRDTPSVVVLDEVSYLSRADVGFEGALQSVWDTHLSRRPVLLVLIGSDRAEMERLTSHGRPFYGRATELSLGPLRPRDVANLTGLPAAEAIDAFLVTGGLPLVLSEWEEGMSVWDFLADSVTSPVSALLVSGERVMTSEFPVEAQARTVLRAIGHGERTFSNIARAAGDIPHASLQRSLGVLTARQAVVEDVPLSTKPAPRNKRYRIEDPYMRFWLAFLSDGIRRIDQGRPDVVLDRIRAGWTSWRGRAVEPVVRRMLHDLTGVIPESAEIGGWWTRTNDVEVDLVGADHAPVAGHVSFVGSVKWRDEHAFDARDLADLVIHRDRVPGTTAETPLVAVTRAAIDLAGVTVVTPQMLVEGA